MGMMSRKARTRGVLRRRYVAGVVVVGEKGLEGCEVGVDGEEEEEGREGG